MHGYQLVVESPSAGVYGEDLSAGAVGAGVLGRSASSGLGPGVGVQGAAGGVNGIGVRGQIQAASTAAPTVAVYGENMSSGTGGAPGAGGFGVYGFSLKGAGLVGATNTAGGAAVVGATNGVAGAYAAVFYGPFVVVGGAKSAAVPHADGSHRLLYCMESPESWFEDFGKGQLECGRADVAIDPDFAAVVDLTDYHVFVTPYGPDIPFVTEQTSEGFRVEAKDPTSTTRFSWRLVAKRKDITAERLATVTLPPEPTRPAAQPPVSPQPLVSPRGRPGYQP